MNHSLVENGILCFFFLKQSLFYLSSGQCFLEKGLSFLPCKWHMLYWKGSFFFYLSTNNAFLNTVLLFYLSSVHCYFEQGLYFLPTKRPMLSWTGSFFSISQATHAFLNRVFLFYLSSDPCFLELGLYIASRHCFLEKGFSFVPFKRQMTSWTVFLFSNY